jgi:hypothetical protein
MKIRSRWIFQGTTPAHGQLYHRDRKIMVIYLSGNVRLYEVASGLPMYPCFGKLLWDRRDCLCNKV